MPPSFLQAEEESGPTRVWLLDRAAYPHGGRWTPSTSDFLNEGGGSSCSLVEVLERCALPTRFFLSSTACAGILHRAVARGRKLPGMLEAALRAGAGDAINLSDEELARLEAAEALQLDDLFGELPSEAIEPEDQ